MNSRATCKLHLGLVDESKKHTLLSWKLLQEIYWAFYQWKEFCTVECLLMQEICFALLDCS